MKVEDLTLSDGYVTLQKGIGNEEKITSSGFDALFSMVQTLNKEQKTADYKIEEVLTGHSDDTHGSLIALQKAELQMHFASVVRDKFVQGYQQIMNMQL
jgi:flagellar hook-basal body complex protein FliE